MTTVLNCFITERLPGHYVPTVFDNYYKDAMVNGKPVKLELWNLMLQEYNKRQMSYPQTDVLLICFSLVKPELFKSVHEKWLPEVRHPVNNCCCFHSKSLYSQPFPTVQFAFSMLL